jgi:hypothetical protein
MYEVVGNMRHGSYTLGTATAWIPIDTIAMAIQHWFDMIRPFSSLKALCRRASVCQRVPSVCSGVATGSACCEEHVATKRVRGQQGAQPIFTFQRFQVLKEVQGFRVRVDDNFFSIPFYPLMQLSCFKLFPDPCWVELALLRCWTNRMEALELHIVLACLGTVITIQL